MVQLVCTDRGQHRSRDIVEMYRPAWGDNPQNTTARWHVLWRDDWAQPRRKGFWPVMPLNPKYRVDLERDLIEADVLVFRCPICEKRRDRWSRDDLDALCDGLVAREKPSFDLSWRD